VATYFEIPIYARVSILDYRSFHWIAEVGFSGRFNATVKEYAEDIQGQVHTSVSYKQNLESVRMQITTGIEYRALKGIVFQVQPSLGLHMFQMQKTFQNTPFSTDLLGLRVAAGYRF
jgi:hypothetical protein